MNDGAVSQDKDMWDWPYIFYVGRNLLGFTDAEIWSLTPRYFKSQWDVHVALKSNQTTQMAKQESKTGYIDQLQGW